MEITTNSIPNWETFIYSEYNLPLLIKQCQQDQFFSHMRIINLKNDISFSEAKSVKQIIKSRPSSDYKDRFLIGHSITHFFYESNTMREKVINESFSLDLSNHFSGEFLADSHIKSCSIPFHLLPDKIVDELKSKPLRQHPLYFTIESLLSRMNASDDKLNIGYKVAAIVNLLSIDDLIEKKDFISDVVIYIKQQMLKGEKINLDAVARNFCMSRRKIQYAFSANNTNYMKIINKIQLEWISVKNLNHY